MGQSVIRKTPVITVTMHYVSINPSDASTVSIPYEDDDIFVIPVISHATSSALDCKVLSDMRATSRIVRVNSTREQTVVVNLVHIK